jgi:hypothetical protein
MSSLRTFSTRVMTRMVFSCVVMFLLALPMMAQSNGSNYVFLLASGFLCDPGDSSTCPATARANQGDSYDMSGAGTFDAQNKSVKAAGTFSHKSPIGNVMETGVWLAGELVSFHSYGAAPGALTRQGTAFGPRRLPRSTGPMPTGGLAVFRIHLLPTRGPSRTAVLQVNCAFGNVPHERSVEGIRLSFEDNGIDFSEELGGRVMFLSMRPEADMAQKPPQQQPVPASARNGDN